MVRKSSTRSLTALAMALAAGPAILAVPAILLPRPVAHAHPPSIQSPAAEAATGEEVTDVLAKLRARLAARAQRDVSALYSAGFTHVDADGRLRDRRAHLVAIARGEAVAEAAELSDLKVRSPNGWVAVVTGRIGEPSRDSSSDLARRASRDPSRARALRATIVLTRSSDGWQIAATHVTHVTPVTTGEGQPTKTKSKSEP